MTALIICVSLIFLIIAALVAQVEIIVGKLCNDSILPGLLTMMVGLNIILIIIGICSGTIEILTH